LAEASRRKYDETLGSRLTDINGIMPLLMQCGFAVGSIACTASLPPQVTLVLVQSGEGKR
jgi:hypothetical protein